MFKNIIMLACASFLALSLVPSAWAVVDISQIPLDAQTKAAPANIMFVLDDSGSMDWEFMTSETNGLFANRYYVFDNPGDNLYSGSLSDDQRLMWKSQWADYNKMYYDPDLTYKPWPAMTDADPDNPRSHPNIAGNYFDLSGTYLQFLDITDIISDIADIIVDNLDAGYSETSGGWGESGAYPEYNGSSRYNSNAGASARWTLNVPQSGEYQVWAWWSSRSTYVRDTAAKYTVTHASGTTDYVRNQNIDFGQWNLLGSHMFNAGTTIVDLLRGNTTTSADAVKLVYGSVNIVNIPRAHYYTYSSSESKPYLVTIDGGNIQYYEVTISGTGSTEVVTALKLDATPPTDVVTSRSYAQERQNFANWYSFYRRRELTATAAVSNVIANMEGVQIGISSINDRINQPVKKIKVNGIDETDSLLSSLYNIVLYANGTPLRRGLQDVGQYFHQDDANTGNIGDCPYWSKELGGECQQAFAILMTDGYWNGDPAGVGNADGNNGVPYADGYSDTLADVAMYYWENDLSAGLDDLVPFSMVDPSSKQHMVTYGVSFGVTGTLDPNNFDLVSGPYPTWPSPWAGNMQRIDDLYHASVNGHGVFLSAGNPSELVDSLLRIMQNIEDRIGSASSVSVNGDEFYKKIDNETYMFQSSYSSTGWTGDVRAFKVDPDTGAIDMNNPEWSAAKKYEDLNWATRKIVSYNGSAGVPFDIGSLTAAQQVSLNPDVGVANDILNYVRGDKGKEINQGGTYRNRSNLLGDIVHSSPIYYDQVLYAGGNDGMLHALIAEGPDAGKELFAYVPSQVIPNLSLLADPSYSHRYYVDLSVAIEGPLLIGDDKTTILVGGLGGGGLGYYALDVGGIVAAGTTVSQSSIGTETALADRVLWEFPNSSTDPTDVADIGFSFSEPLIVKTNDSSQGWVVLFGNGYNSASGKSVLFALNPEDGSVLKKFELGSGPDNGLATPAVIDVDADGRADYVYAGDLAGDLWKIDLTGSISNWKCAFEKSSVVMPLFSANGPGGARQPITSKPDVMYHPEKHGYLVILGTGKFLGLSDFLDKSVQTIYGVWDYGDDSDDSEYLGSFDRSNNQLSNQLGNITLLEQEIIDYQVLGDERVRTVSDNPIVWETELDIDSPLPNLSSNLLNNAGWFVDLPVGERVVNRVLIRDGRAIVISFAPKDSPCSTGGNSDFYEFDAKDGSRLDYPAFDLNQDGSVDEKDLIVIRDPNTGEFIRVAPTGIEREGQLQTPAILKIGDEEIKYMSSSSGTIVMVREKGVRLGITTWQEF